MVYMDAHSVCKIFKGNPATGEVQVVAENTIGSCLSTAPISGINNTLATNQARDFTHIGMMPNGDILYNAGKVSCLHARVGHSIARVQLVRCAIKTRHLAPHQLSLIPCLLQFWLFRIDKATGIQYSIMAGATSTPLNTLSSYPATTQSGDPMGFIVDSDGGIVWTDLINRACSSSARGRLSCSMLLSRCDARLRLASARAYNCTQYTCLFAFALYRLLQCIRKLDSTYTTVTTIAGICGTTTTFGGPLLDNVDATTSAIASSVNAPYGNLDLGPDGAIYIADNANHCKSLGWIHSSTPACPDVPRSCLSARHPACLPLQRVVIDDRAFRVCFAQVCAGSASKTAPAALFHPAPSNGTQTTPHPRAAREAALQAVAVRATVSSC
jgi:hypothetical protein